MKNEKRNFNGKRTMLVLLVFAFTIAGFLLLRSGSSAQGEDAFQRFLYPTDFSDCFTVAEKKDKCKIPEEILSGMTEKELVWAVIDYPFLWEVGCSSQQPGGFSAWLAADSDAFAKLARYDSPEDKIMKVLKAARETEGEDASNINLACQIFCDGQGSYFDFSKKQLEFLGEAKVFGGY